MENLHIELINDFYEPSNFKDVKPLFLKSLHGFCFQNMKTRSVLEFGKPYEYSNYLASGNTRHFGDSLAVLSLKMKIEFQMNHGLNNCLVNHYEDGSQSMGYHSDDTSQLMEGTGIYIFSLGSDRVLTFKNKVTKVETEVLIKENSLLILSKKNNEEFLHSLKKCDSKNPRYSLTFRLIK